MIKKRKKIVKEKYPWLNADIIIARKKRRAAEKKWERKKDKRK